VVGCLGPVSKENAHHGRKGARKGWLADGQVGRLFRRDCLGIRSCYSWKWQAENTNKDSYRLPEDRGRGALSSCLSSTKLPNIRSTLVQEVNLRIVTPDYSFHGSF
jgi:hypothetical protein